MQFFKYLVRNDIGRNSHQAGPVVPNSCIGYFPDLRTDRISSAHPSESASIQCHLFVDGSLAGIANSSFQFQTWGGTRRPEYRITSGLEPLMASAIPGDLVIFTRLSEDSFRVDLHTAASPLRGELDTKINQARVEGLTYQTAQPSGLIEFTVKAQKSVPLTPLFENRTLAEMEMTARIKRDRKFRAQLIIAYDGRCAISGESMCVPNTNQTELEGAHIIPVGSNGSDQIKNGFLLNSRLHWAFDKGLIFVDKSYCIRLPQSVLAESRNGYLHGFAGVKLRLPANLVAHPAPEAFDWHRENMSLPS